MPIAPEKVGLLLLAAGRSERFGETSKLGAPLGDLPLGLHICRTIGHFPFFSRVAITSPGTPDYSVEGFTQIETDRPMAGQGYSLAFGIRALTQLSIDACFILLADMPFVTANHIGAVMNAFEGDVVGSALAGRPMPPALIGRQHFSALAQLEADFGARKLIANGKLIEGNAQCLADVDTPEDLSRLSPNSMG